MYIKVQGTGTNHWLLGKLHSPLLYWDVFYLGKCNMFHQSQIFQRLFRGEDYLLYSLLLLIA